MLFKTIVHQTVQNKGGIPKIEAEGPFPAEDWTLTYLGNGCYFWDNHLELAKWWGSRHCKNNYVICRGEFEAQEEVFLDLVGSRASQIQLNDLINKLDITHLSMCAIIETLKELNSQEGYEGIFPYEAIRAVDLFKGTFEQEKYKFSDNKNGYTLLNPMYIICLINKNSLLLKSYKAIFIH